MHRFLKVIFILTAVVSTSGLVQAQDALFRVLASKGQVHTTSTAPTSSGKVMVNIGRRLFHHEKLEVSKDSYLGLMHKSGKTIEIKEPGSYNIADLDKKLLATSKVSQSQKFASFVVDQVSQQDEKDISKNHQLYMAVTGAVMRALPQSASMALKPLVPPTSVLPNKEYKLSWFKEPDVNEFTVRVFDLSEEVVHTVTVKDTTCILPLGTDMKKRNEDISFIQITAVGNPRVKSSMHPIKLLAPSFVIQVQKTIDEMDKDNPVSSASCIAKAMFFEENDLYLDALEMYQQAIQLSAGIADYQMLYEEFLHRSGLIIDKPKIKY